MNRIRILAPDGACLAQKEGAGEVCLYYPGAYQAGCAIAFASDHKHVCVRVDQAVDEARLYLPDGTFTYRPPIDGDGLCVYAPGAFVGGGHMLWLRAAEDNPYRNLARNPVDQRGPVSAFPHATANVETRGEAAFAARNVIDGCHLAAGHGSWPYGSWGIGAREDAFLTLEFGREVEISAAALCLRADFPHDAYWVRAAIALSDGFVTTFPLEGREGPQRVELGLHRVTWLQLEKLVKCDNPSAFPSLRQLEVYGRDA